MQRRRVWLRCWARAATALFGNRTSNGRSDDDFEVCSPPLPRNRAAYSMTAREPASSRNSQQDTNEQEEARDDSE